MMRTKQMTITPAKAAELLKRNKINRVIRKPHVLFLAGQMERGEWKITHQGIAISRSGNLPDGQHRLLAIIKSGVTVVMNVTEDVPDDAYTVMDQGARRNAGDILGLDKRQSEVVRLAVRTVSSAPITPKALQAMHKAIGPVVAELIKHCGRTNKFFSSAPMRLAAIARVLDGADKDYVFDLYGNLVNGNLDELPPIGKGIVKQYVRGGIDSGDSRQKLARGFTVFNPSSRDVSRVQVKDPDVAFDSVRNILFRAQLDAGV